MVLGNPIPKRAFVRKPIKEQKEENEFLFSKKITKLANAIKIPPVINQFKKVSVNREVKRLCELFAENRPEIHDKN